MTPIIPTTTPASRRGVILSSGVNAWATMTVHSGVVALRIEPRPLGMWVMAHISKQNGSALLRKPIAQSAIHDLRSVGRGAPVARRIASSTSAASATRSTTMVTGGSSLSATPAK